MVVQIKIDLVKSLVTNCCWFSHLACMLVFVWYYINGLRR